jgi:hypothetical protein
MANLPGIEDATALTRITAEYEEAQTNARRLLETLRRQVDEDNRVMGEAGETTMPTTTSTGESGRELYGHGQRPSAFGRWYDRALDAVPAARPHRRTEDVVSVPPPPEPLSKEEMQILDECKVCFAQHCDMLLLPCAHLALCEVSPSLSLLKGAV